MNQVMRGKFAYSEHPESYSMASHLIGSSAVDLMSRVAVKRLKKEYDEIERNLADLPFTIHPLEDNFLEWHFTLQGPHDSVYAHGLYHGRLVFPNDYPFSPPTLMFLNASGRFQTATKICLSVTGFHPEHWQPAWGARTMLIAIRNHFCVEDRGALGYLEMTELERRRLAAESRLFNCSHCGYRGPHDQPASLDPITGESSLSDSAQLASPPSSTVTKRQASKESSAQLFGLLIVFGVIVLFLALNYHYNTAG